MEPIAKLNSYINSAIPYAWDDSESWFEFLGKVLAKVNEIIEKTNDYFDVDIKQFVVDKLNEWKTDGTLNSIVNIVFEDYDTRIDALAAQIEDITLNAKHHFNMIGDGSDETEKFQTALNDSVGKTLFLPKPITYYYIGKVNIPSYTTLVFDEGIEIVGKPLLQAGVGVTTERLINIIGVSNVVIKGNHSIVRLENKSQYNEEWNHIFNINSSNNVYIYDVSANDSGGDGFYVGDLGSIGETPKNINLINCKANNNRRQGLSILTVDGFYAENCAFNNSNGTAPETGVDIEPNLARHKLKNIKFVNCVAQGNLKDGVRIHLRKQNNTSEKIDIELINFVSKNNGFGYSQRDYAGVQGVVNFVNCVSEENKWAGFVERGNEVDSIKTIYSGCKSINDNVVGVNYTTWQYGNGSAFVFMAEKSGQTIGNSYVYDCFVIDTRTPKKIIYAISAYSNSALEDIATDNVFIKNLKADDGVGYLYAYGLTQNTNISITESESDLREKDVASHSGSYRNVYPIDNNVIVTNKGATGAIKHRLTQPFDNLVYRFRVDEPQSVTIDTLNFGILGVPTGSNYISNIPGSYLVLKGTSDGYYVVITMVGEWNAPTEPDPE